MKPMTSEVAAKADFGEIRYAQCWEDADILLEALDVQPGDNCLSIASAGDNALALLTRLPAHVLALDLSQAQLSCVELRVAAYRALEHPELLELVGSRPSRRRYTLYRRCRPLLSGPCRQFWDARPAAVSTGVGGAGKFERYFARFRRYLLPLVHSRGQINSLLKGGAIEERRSFYCKHWDCWRWRLLFQIFFSRFVMGRMGRDPSFFAYVEGDVASRILERARYAVTELNPAANPYLQWIMTGRHTSALPLALRPEHFETIRANLDRLEWRCQSVEDYLAESEPRSVDRFNLSDIFEYMSLENYHRLLARLSTLGKPGGRLVYWNMLAPRSRPEALIDSLKPLASLSERLFKEDKAFFYSRLVVEEVLGP
jgi:S-adenosylmethionine-diacylglycerol 3-amino-3-carboxypropyl transferase